MSDIVKIIVRGESALQNPRAIYKDRLTLEREAVAYEYHPLFKTARDPMRKWNYESAAPDYVERFEALCGLIPQVMAIEDREFDHEAPCTQFQVEYADGTGCKETFYLKRETFRAFFDVARAMMPAGEELPTVLAEEDD